MPDYVLPPLRHAPIARKGRFEAWLDSLLLRAVVTETSWRWIALRWALYIAALYTLVIAPVFIDQMSLGRWLSFVLGFALAISIATPDFRRRLAVLSLRFGHAYPYVLRPWRRLAVWMQRRLAEVRPVTVRTLFWRRLFTVDPETGQFKTGRMVLNWLSFLLLLYVSPMVAETVLDGAYAYSTYPFGTYDDIIVTQAYRNIRDQSTYSIHGYKVVNGEKQEYYFELGSTLWFWQLYPEYLFGQVPILGRCTFHTYGMTVRVWRKFRIFSAGSVYALNPWVVGIQCTAPNVVPHENGGA